jgi:VIT1/CCC1 family predicted Fe2+/Mn2+ transporter
MSKSRRPRRNTDDPIGDLHEWQSHQYDPGYWSNLGRLRLFAGGRATKGHALLTALGGLFALVLIFIVLIQSGLPFSAASVLVALAMIALLAFTLARLNPTHSQHSTRGRRRR